MGTVPVVVDDFAENEHLWAGVGEGVEVVSAGEGRLVVRLEPGETARRLAPQAPEPLEAPARLRVTLYVSGEALGTRVRLAALGAGIGRIPGQRWYLSHAIVLPREGRNVVSLSPQELVDDSQGRLLAGQAVTQLALYFIPTAPCTLIVEEIAADVYEELPALRLIGPRTLDQLTAEMPQGPRTAAAHLARARALAWTELTASTLFEFRAAMTAGDERVSPLAGYELLDYLAEARLLLASDSARAWALLSARYPTTPHTAAAAARLGWLLAERGASDAARLMADHLIAHFPDTVWEARGQTIRAEVRRAAGDVGAALTARERAAMLSPAIRRETLAWLVSLADQLRRSEALRDLLHAELVAGTLAELLPTEREAAARLWLRIAEDHLRLHEFRRTADLCEMLLEQYPEQRPICAGAQTRTGDALRGLGRASEAVSAYEAAAQDHPGEAWWAAEALYAAAECLREAGDADGALRLYQRVVLEHAERTRARQARLGIARLCLQSGRPDDLRAGQEAVEQVIARWPQTEEAAAARELAPKIRRRLREE